MPEIELTTIRSLGPGGEPRPAKNMTQEKVLQILFKIMKGTELCTLSTVTPKNMAHSAHVYFAFTQALELYFLSDPHSLHCSNLKTNPSMSVSIYDSTQTWGNKTGDVGIALYGTCKETNGKEADRAGQIYGRRFKCYSKWRTNPNYLKEARDWRIYKFVASRVKIFDEARFGSAVFITASVKAKPFATL